MEAYAFERKTGTLRRIRNGSPELAALVQSMGERDSAEADLAARAGVPVRILGWNYRPTETHDYDARLGCCWAITRNPASKDWMFVDGRGRPCGGDLPLDGMVARLRRIHATPAEERETLRALSNGAIP